MIIGYARVSTIEQNEQSQVDLLKNYGCEKIFCDKESGTNDDRRQFLLLKECLRPHDTVVVSELSRLGRRLLSVLEFIQEIKNNNINFVSLRENIDLSSSTGTLVLQIMASIAEFERNRLLERQKVGIDYARKHGVKFGRPGTDEKKLEQALKLYATKSMSVKDICDLTGVSKSVLYRNVRKS